MKNLLLPLCGVAVVFCFAIPKNSADTTDLNQDQNTKRQTEKQFLNPNDLHVTAGYTHVVAANQGKMIFVSGQVALNKQGEVVGKGDLREQTTQVFENLKVALVAAGATFAWLCLKSPCCPKSRFSASKVFSHSLFGFADYDLQTAVCEFVSVLTANNRFCSSAVRAGAHNALSIT